MDYKYQIKAVTADAVIFSIIDKKLHCLLIKRGVSPFEGKWALPGGFLKRNESAEDAFKRELLEESGQSHTGLNSWREFKSYSDPKRDPRNNNDYQIISIAFVGVAIERNIKIKSGSDASEVSMLPYEKIEKAKLAFDHYKIISDAKEYLSERIEKENLALDFLPSQFSLSELRNVYEELWEKSLHASNFERKVNSFNGFIKKTSNTRIDGSHRPATLYKKGNNSKILILNN